MAINTSEAILKHQKQEQLRLQKYMNETVQKQLAYFRSMTNRSRVQNSKLEFWEREEIKTQRKLDSFI